MVCKSCGAKWRLGNRRKINDYCPVCGCYFEFKPESVGFPDIRELICYIEHCKEKDFYWTTEVFLAMTDSFLDLNERMRSEIKILLEQGVRKDVEQWRVYTPSLDDIRRRLLSFRLPFSVETYAADLHYVFGNVYDPGDDVDSAAFFLEYAKNSTLPAYELQALLRAGQLGSTDAAIRAAKGLEKGDYGKKDHNTELYILKAVESSENPEIWYQIGRMYSLGWGTPVDSETAMEYFRKAADRGHTKAEYQISIGLSENGREEEGINYLRKSAEKGYLPAMFELAERLLRGIGLAQNEKEGIRLLKECARNGNREASDMLHGILDRE